MRTWRPFPAEGEPRTWRTHGAAARWRLPAILWRQLMPLGRHRPALSLVTGTGAMSTRDRDRDDVPIEVVNLSIISDGRHVGKVVQVVDLHHALRVGIQKGVLDLCIELNDGNDWDCVKPLADVMSKADWEELLPEEIDLMRKRWDQDDPELICELCLELAVDLIEWSKNVRCARNRFNRHMRTVGWYTIYHD